ncbi:MULTISPECIES: ATP-binding protein [unclassified Maridesulfovibrio]|uniref:ATP-binding protein n=1 Tax=unclassified Maridesulfovibrio TaxID=2794999 RepID=UPI003B3D06FA
MDYTTLAPNDRLVSGRVVQKDIGVFHIKLNPNSIRADSARISSDNCPDNFCIDELKIGQEVTVFLLSPKLNSGGLWYASLLLAVEDNPWFTNIVKRGEIVGGTVVNYHGYKTAIIRLDHPYTGLEARLDIKDIPNFGTDISDFLLIGDIVKGKICEIDIGNILIKISVNELLEELEDKELEYREKMLNESDRTEHLPQPAQNKDDAITSDDTKTLKDCSVLIIDDDHDFTRELMLWLKSLGATSMICRTPEDVKLRLNKHSFSHILLDYQLDQSPYFKQIRSFLKNIPIPVSIMTAVAYTDIKSEKLNSWGYLQKPLSCDNLMNWLVSGEQPEYSDSQVFDPIWKNSTRTDEVLCKVNRFLGELCEDIGSCAALWCVEEWKRKFSIRAWFNLLREDMLMLQPSCQHTAIRTATSSGTPIALPLYKSGALEKCAPKEAKHVLAWPLEVDGKTDRCIVCYSKKEFSKTQISKIQHNQSRMLDLVDWLQLTRYLDETETFAAMGRVAASSLHEIRGVASPIVQSSVRLRAKAKRISSLSKTEIMELQEDLRMLAVSAKTLERTAKANLAHIQLERREKFRARTNIKRVIKLIKSSALEKEIRIITELPNTNLTTSIAPTPIEQPLLNILTNAIDHLDKDCWGTITVTVEFHFEDDPQRPLHIYIEDNGPGIKSDTRENLFTARSSTRGIDGVGLGLYLSRNLLRSIGGDLLLVKSIRWIGTTFCMKVPVKINS